MIQTWRLQYRIRALGSTAEVEPKHTTQSAFFLLTSEEFRQADADIRTRFGEGGGDSGPSILEALISYNNITSSSMGPAVRACCIPKR